MFDPKKPYYDLPLLPPKQALESIELYKALVPASEALATLSATAEHLPNQAALYQSVILLEAKASSEIEQVLTTDGKLFGSELPEKAIDPMTKEVLRYSEAIRHGLKARRPLCTTIMEEICSIIRDKPVKVRKVPGTALERAGQIIYTPPDREKLLRDLLDNLFIWMNNKDQIHPIIKAAIAHYQFESIHPFTDGNGRTGRIMVVLYLVEQKLLNAPVLFLSGEILIDRNTYYSLLQSTHESNDFFPYLIWFVKLIHRASLQSTIRANKVRIAMQNVKNKIRELDAHMYSQDLVNILFRGPIIFANHLVDHGVTGSVSTAHTYLKKLEAAGLLIRSNELYNRKIGYINWNLLDALKGEIDLL
ncbi:MAG: Protein adenylyltransferase SoFic [Candidatus Scalindua arabica]|uniref:Protein adenylyltransferase SoFic n=1 Tax=Candidatus Scalindua arabica TaxID=1127984 RepID=A0A942A388_9BACT|nr:Protein adenylyltransferase SoFic [Candidatus Scalindua arabica]